MSSDKQENINRMINRQYDQLLEMCEKSASELEYIKQNLLNDDFGQQSEIEKTEALISSIVHDVNVKKKELQNLALKNRYDQLVSLYQQTQDEVQMLEANLEKEMPLLEADQLEVFAQAQADLPETDELPNAEAPFKMPKYFRRKGERLNLNNLSLPAVKKEQHEDFVDTWHDSLAKIDEIEKEQLITDFNLPPIPMDEVDESFNAVETTLDFQLPEVPIFDEPLVPTEIESKERLFKKKVQKPANKRFRGLKIFLNILFYLVLISSILFAFVFGMDNHNHTSNGAPSQLFGYSVMRVATGSMSPTLRVDTVIVTRYVDPTELRIDDIVTFLIDGERTVTHRVYQIYENYQNLDTYGFRLIGDANDGIADDTVLLAEDLVGRVIFDNYAIGRTLMFIHRYFLTIMAVFAFSLVLLFVIKVRFKFKKRHQDAMKI